MSEKKKTPQEPETTRVVDGQVFRVRQLPGTDGNVDIGNVRGRWSRRTEISAVHQRRKVVKKP